MLEVREERLRLKEFGGDSTFAVYDGDDDIAKFKSKADAELFLRAKEHEAMAEKARTELLKDCEPVILGE